MTRDEICSIGTTFVDEEDYELSRYEETEQDLYFKVWNEIFENSPVINDEKFKRKSWEDVLSDENKLQLKIKNKEEKIKKYIPMIRVHAEVKKVLW
ncbi:MAG: hypothetical protein ACI4GW_05470 [Lachnospiraceae bacterium]